MAHNVMTPTLSLATSGQTRTAARARQALQMALTTLDCMAKGGMFDHLGGGFSRYSVDEYWHVPHFEKMLYDNAQLVLSYLHAFQITKNARYKEVAEQTLAYIVRDLKMPGGGVYSAEDADSYEPDTETEKKDSDKSNDEHKEKKEGRILCLDRKRIRGDSEQR